MVGTSFSSLLAGAVGPPRPPKIGERLASQLVQVGAAESALLEDCLTTEEWFELARDTEIHCREHLGCL